MISLIYGILKTSEKDIRLAVGYRSVEGVGSGNWGKEVVKRYSLPVKR